MPRAGPGHVREDRPAGPAPSPVTLREAALRHLSRFAATEAGLVRVLDRAIRRWAARAAAEGLETSGPERLAKAAARTVSADLVRAGAVDDAVFAGARAARLSRAGRSRRAVMAHLTGKGVDADTIAAAMTTLGDELAAALLYARRRRIGPFRPDPSSEHHLSDLAALGRAGFPRELAERALSMDPAAADEMVLAARRS